MLDKEEYIRWMESAIRTLESARGDFERGDYNWSCFKAQQAAEMAIKALLHGAGMPAYGHSISRLLLLLISKNVDVPEKIIEYAKKLDKLYVPTRYPNAWAEGAPHEYYTKLDATEAIDSAREIINWVKELWRFLEKEGSIEKK
ncbi:MAG: DNA-binding protein [Thermoprotei archaeon]|nr:MAG: DNA-binding protein [Thermoprotei archaeon]